MATIDALFFDVFGTVVDWRTSVARGLESYGTSRGMKADWGRLADAWRSFYDPYMGEVRAGRRAWTKLDQLQTENLADAFAALGLAVPGEDDRRALAHCWHKLDPWPDAVEGLTRIKKSYIVAPVSNGHIRLMVDIARHAGLPWDTVLGAEIARTYKPDRQVYLASAAGLDLPPERCMMVAAHAGDLAAAGALGLKTAFVARPLEYGPGGKTDSSPAGVDISAGDFIDLARQLGC